MWNAMHRRLRTLLLLLALCETAQMNRRTLDTAVPMIYGILVVVMYLTVSGKVATIITMTSARNAQGS